MAVVGGNFGETHVQGFRLCPKIEVVAICRRQKDLARQLAQKYRIKKFYTDFNQIVRSPEIDVLSLAVPHHLHYPMTMEALDHGKHVICEKPLALNVTEATEMLKKAEAKRLVHMTVFNWRFVPAIFQMKELIEQGEIGSINHISFNWLNNESRDRDRRFIWRFSKAESGFGALGTNGVHGIDIIQWIFGDFRRIVSHMAIHMPEHLTDNGEYRKMEVEDSCSFLGELTLQEQVIFHVSTVSSYDSVMRLEAHGKRGFLGVELFAKAPDYYGKLFGGKEENSLEKVLPIPKKLKWDIRLLNKGVSPRVLFFTRFARQLVKAIEKGETPCPSFLDGLKVQRVLETLAISWREKEWIELV